MHKSGGDGTGLTGRKIEMRADDKDIHGTKTPSERSSYDGNLPPRLKFREASD